MGGMIVVVFIFVIIFVFSAFGELDKSSRTKPNSLFKDEYTKKSEKKEVKKIDEVYGDIEDVWAKFDEETEKRNSSKRI